MSDRKFSDRNEVAGLDVALVSSEKRQTDRVEHWAEAARLAAGDVGARPFLRAHPELITLVECADTGRPDDIDTAEDLDRIRRLMTGTPAPPSDGSRPRPARG